MGGTSKWVGFGGGEGGTISNPGVAYVQTNGNDSTAQLGNPAKPYLTGNAGYTASAAANGGTKASLHFGVGAFTFNNWGNSVPVFVSGEGVSATTLDITRFGTTGVAGANGAAATTLDGETVNTPATDGGTGGNGGATPILRLSSDYSILVTGQVSGGIGGVGGFGGSSITLTDYSDPENPLPYEAGSGNGGNGGSTGRSEVYIDRCVISTLILGNNGGGAGGAAGGEDTIPGNQGFYYGSATAHQLRDCIQVSGYLNIYQSPKVLSSRIISGGLYSTTGCIVEDSVFKVSLGVGDTGSFTGGFILRNCNIEYLEYDFIVDQFQPVIEFCRVGTTLDVNLSVATILSSRVDGVFTA
jgi:hypothetical protein